MKLSRSFLPTGPLHRLPHRQTIGRVSAFRIDDFRDKWEDNKTTPWLNSV